MVIQFTNKVLEEFFLRKKPQCFRLKKHTDNRATEEKNFFNLELCFVWVHVSSGSLQKAALAEQTRKDF